MDPHRPHHCSVCIPADFVGIHGEQCYRVVDLLTGATYTWGRNNYVLLDPALQPAHVFEVLS
jgi:starch synthase (maltosyl-transferring)